MKYLALLLFLISSSVAHAQTEAPNPNASCGPVLQEPPFVDMLTRNDGYDYGELNSDSLGVSLLGIVCSRDQIMDYFSSAGWEFKGESFIAGESGPPSDRYKQDYSIAFCKVRAWPWRWFLYRCEAIAGVTFFEGQIVRVVAYINY